MVAMRGDAPYLAVVTSGGMMIYQVGLEGDAAQARVSIGKANDDRRIVIPHLGNLRPQTPANRRWISDVILRLLTSALDELAHLAVADGDAISLVGRALFVSFLADRDMLHETVCTIAADDQIAFALHARLLFQRGETMPEACNALFGALDVTGIVNGTELRRTRVWPEITAPFCLLFACNTVPSVGAGFRFTNLILKAR